MKDKRRSNCIKERWGCAKLRYVKSQRGNTLLRLNNYNFTLRKRTSKVHNKKRWVCSTHINRGCKAAVTTINDAVVSRKYEHNHQPTTFVTSQRGNTLLRIGSYTFYYKKPKPGGTAHKKRWVCSTHFSRGCKAVVYTVDDEIVTLRHDHSHEPTNTYRGKY
ncbi:unnamed protein product, partial [Iphiclides podalirius]